MNKEFRHQLFTSFDLASSFTSTNFLPSNETEFRVLSDAEIRGLYYSKIKEKHHKGIQNDLNCFLKKYFIKDLCVLSQTLGHLISSYIVTKYPKHVRTLSSSVKKNIIMEPNFTD
jgi:hypothetical protein